MRPEAAVRRRPSYNLTPFASPVGGCTFYCDAAQDYAQAAPIWSAAVDPHVIRARAHPCDSETPLGLHVDGLGHRVAVSQSAEHVLVRTCDTSLRLDVIDGTVLAGPVLLEPILALERLEWQIAATRKLDALLRGVAPPHENDPRLARLVLALRALDARSEGASLRDLATGIFGTTDWPGDGENVKSRARRLVELADKLRRAGPRGVSARRI